ncbi:DUF4232 domain-containing protein [Streptomyces sp. NPDC005573]|uniref:DUF4232 domain-containing protein n=1 Tax=Streptomyces sp. NPDC005573 TaxID=3156890 RepID=UPI0033B961CB
MRRPFGDRAVVGTLALTATLALAGCGAGQTASPGASGGTSPRPACTSGAPGHDAPSLARPTVTADVPRPPGSPSPVPSAAPGAAQDGVRITGIYSGAMDEDGTCRQSSLTAAFSLTNPSRREMTYTIVFDARGYTGATRVVGSVKPGRTLHGTVAMARSYGDVAQGANVSVLSVRSVPTAEAPSTGGPCPASGVRVYADRGDAAMGLRVMGLHLENCGRSPYTLEGRPLLRIVDADHEPVEGIRVVPGEQVALLDNSPDLVRPLTLRPGERARADIAWRNTVEAFGGAVNAPYLRVRAKAGAAPVMVTPELDLGTTGRLGVRAWRKEP